MKNAILLSLITLLISFTVFSCNKDDDNNNPTNNTITTAADLTDALQSYYNDSEAPGFAVSVVSNDAIIYQQSFGKADIDENKAYTNQTIQSIGSISKTFIAAAIVKAIEHGHFTLETDINDILPVEIKNPKQPNAVIQVKHLVTHTSGLIDENDSYFQAYHILPGENLSTEGSQILTNALGFQQREGIPLEDFLAEYYLEEGDLYSMDNFAATTPGTSWSYSNIASSLAAYLIEAATETAFEDYVITNVLQPLGMNNTAYQPADLNTNNIAKLYWDKNTPLPIYGNDSYPDGSIMTSNEDLGKYLLDMMKGAKGQSTTLFSKESYELLFEALLPEGKINPAVGDNQAIFWILQDGKIKHDGSDPGTTCDLKFDAAGDEGYFFLTNMDASTEDHLVVWRELAGNVSDAIQEFINNN